MGNKDATYWLKTMGLSCLSPLFTMPISLVYDAHLPCLRFYFACLMPDSRIFELTFLYVLNAWYAWLMGVGLSIVLSV